MLGGSIRASFLVGVALAAATDPASASGRHHRGRSGYLYAGYPAPYVYGPAYTPGFALGVAHYPVALGFSLPWGPTDPRGSLRTLVDPRDAEVFIDGYYVGVVDDFDGVLQGLRLDPGPHTVSLYREGYRLHEESVYSALGATVKIRHEMVPLAPGEANPPRPAPGGAPAAIPSASPPPAPASTTPAPPAASASVTAADYGRLVLRASPPDAEIWIDGERWHFPPGSDRFVVHLTAGAHALELSKVGYEGFSSEVEILPGDTVTMNVVLGSPSSP